MATEQIGFKIKAKRSGVADSPALSRFLNQSFYFAMSLLITAVVIYGFSHTVENNLIRATPPRPWLLWVHGAVFSGWLAFFTFQSALVRTHNVRLHRRIGWFGVALGVAIPVLGISTAIIMTRFRVLQLHAVNDAVTDLIGPFFEMTAFTVSFALAIYWRKKPEFHRRLLLLATCALTAAAFSRFPPDPLPALPNVLNLFGYAAMDVLILLGVARDLIVTKRIHRVYLYGLPAFIVGQTIVIYMYDFDWQYCVKIARYIAR